MLGPLVLLIGILQISNGQIYQIGPTSTFPEHFPYHAYVKSRLYCLGALISTRFVVVNADCIHGSWRATVTLGTLNNPYYSGRGYGQEIKAMQLIVHPEYSKRYYDKLQINNIGLIELAEDAMITTTVKPIDLPQASDFPIAPGTLLNLTGYLDSLFSSDALHFMVVKVKPQKGCIAYFGKSLIKENEQCHVGIGPDRLDWPGTLAYNGKLVGISRVLSSEAHCVISSPPCNRHDVFLTLRHYIDWIHNTTGIPRLSNDKQTENDEKKGQDKGEKENDNGDEEKPVTVLPDAVEDKPKATLKLPPGGDVVIEHRPNVGRQVDAAAKYVVHDEPSAINVKPGKSYIVHHEPQVTIIKHKPKVTVVEEEPNVDGSPCNPTVAKPAGADVETFSVEVHGPMSSSLVAWPRTKGVDKKGKYV